MANQRAIPGPQSPFAYFPCISCSRGCPCDTILAGTATSPFFLSWTYDVWACIVHFATMKQKIVKTKNQLVGNSETKDKIALLSNASKPMQVISFFQNTRCEEKTFCLCKPLLQPNAFQLRR